MNDLPDALLGDAKGVSQSGYRLTVLVTRTDFSIAFTLGRRAIGNRVLRENHAAIRDGNRECHGEKHLGE